MKKCHFSTPRSLPGYTNDNQVFVVNTATGATEEAASLPLAPDVELYNAQCGLAVRPDGSRVVVLAGGIEALFGVTEDFATARSYVYDLEGGSWLPGPSMPVIRTWGRAVQYQVRDNSQRSSTYPNSVCPDFFRQNDAQDIDQNARKNAPA